MAAKKVKPEEKKEDKKNEAKGKMAPPFAKKKKGY